MPTSLIALLDDIATVLDDVATFTKVATKKTAGVLGDDLALNAQQVAGVRADRELSVVWAVAKGSLLNKAILVPSALAISALASWAITPLLMMGGAFLCFEGCEKLWHKFMHREQDHVAEHAQLLDALADPTADLVVVEKDKIKGAIRTDLILSAEIVVIALGTVATATFSTRVAVLVALALLMTVGVYGLVAAIVKLDDLGLALNERSRRTGAALAGLQGSLGTAILLTAPWLMKSLSVAGTIAMFLVGGGILAHGIPGVHEIVHHHAESSRSIRGLGPLLASVIPTLYDFVLGVVAGTIVLGAWSGLKRLRPAKSAG